MHYLVKDCIQDRYAVPTIGPTNWSQWSRSGALPELVGGTDEMTTV